MNTNSNQFEWDSKHSNANSKHSKVIQSIRKLFKAFECKFEPFERDSKHSNANSNHSKGIRSFQMEIITISKGFEAFNCEFGQFEMDS